MDQPRAAASVSFAASSAIARDSEGVDHDDAYQMYEDGYDSAMALSRAPNENFKVTHVYSAEASARVASMSAEWLAQTLPLPSRLAPTAHTTCDAMQVAIRVRPSLPREYKVLTIVRVTANTAAAADSGHARGCT